MCSYLYKMRQATTFSEQHLASVRVGVRVRVCALIMKLLLLTTESDFKLKFKHWLHQQQWQWQWQSMSCCRTSASLNIPCTPKHTRTHTFCQLLQLDWFNWITVLLHRLYYSLPSTEHVYHFCLWSFNLLRRLFLFLLLLLLLLQSVCSFGSTFFAHVCVLCMA